MRGHSIVIAALLASSLLAAQGPNQGRGPGRGMRRPAPATMLDRLETMSPEERKRVLDKLPPERRQQLQQRLDHYDAMSPEQRERMRRQLSWFRQLPPERQEETRQLFRRLNGLPEERRREVHRAVRMLGRLDEERRNMRMNSRAFRDRFSPEEQKMVRGLLEMSLEQQPPNQ